MAEVESISVAVNLPTETPQISKNVDIIAAATTTTTVTNKTTNMTDTHAAAEPSPSAETGTSPTQERSSNSHPHDSEYDTATDLEGAEEYDEEEESVTEDEDYDESDEEHEKHEEGDEESSNAEKADGEAPKKVDEDRRNPQYIPKRGTFYEHDDREDEVAAETKTAKVVAAPASQPPKTRKWQPTHGSDRWSHDRFDASEQAPKSAAELVSAYGYDIRNEEAPPRARRRRRYAKGPTRYQRNWEDENAYSRSNTNKERRPPRPSDFPALDERAPKGRKSVNARLQRSGRNEEYENQGETPSVNSDRQSDSWSGAGHKTHNKFAGNERRSNANSGRHQAPMQFKSKQRRNQGGDHNNRNNSEQYERKSQGQHQQQQQQQHTHAGSSNVMESNKYSNSLQQIQTKSAQQNYGKENSYNNTTNNNSNNAGLLDQVYRGQTPTTTAAGVQQQQLMRQQQKPTPPSATTNLQQRLQQVQNRNDPSHVGSVQMHTLATQNQMPVKSPAAGLLMQQQQQQQQQQQLSQEQQRGPPKRYSSIRRSQHDAHLSDHQLQQLQQQQQQQQQQQPQAMMLPPEQQHMLAQAQLMQHLYHQEKLQAQMQALQVSQPPPAAGGVAKTTAYSTVPGAPPATAQGYAPNNATAGNVPPAGYYVAAAPPPEAASYPPQPAPATNYLPAAPYGPAPAPAGPPAGAYTAPPGAAVSAAAAAVVSGQPTSSANPNFANYQNYNTVGGTTYFVPPVQPTARPVVLPQRRPTNAIPILPPETSERAKQQLQQRGGSDPKDEMNVTGIDHAENIDHILDNMFVQRPVFQPPRKSTSPPVAEQGDVTPLASQTEEALINTEQQPDLNVHVVEPQENTTIEKTTQEQ